MFALVPANGENTFRLAGARTRALYRRCENFTSPAACNWIVPVGNSQSAPKLCVSCRLNRTIPDLSKAENATWWGRIELAKRRVISSLVAMGLPVCSRATEDPQNGLAFDLLRSVPGGPRVMTGHDNGVITLNVEEADDAKREQIRLQMHEPYRTLVGHFRHEVGHYYWDRLVAGSTWLEGYRELFGDERADYGAALRKHHQQGPPSGWSRTFVSAYASSHPWEDWAETWAHYMHMRDTLGTAASFGLNSSIAGLQIDPFPKTALHDPDEAGAEDFLNFLNSWVELTTVLNELSRSMGQLDFYPFALPVKAVAKLHFVHRVVTSRQEQCAPALRAATGSAE